MKPKNQKNISFKIRQYFFSFSTQLGLCVGTLMYVAYAFAFQNWQNLTLISVAILLGILLPFYSTLSNKVEELIGLKTAIVTYGRIVRFVLQYILNFAIFSAFIKGEVITTTSAQGLGGVFGLTLLTTAASQGVQYFAIALSNREYGNKNVNVLMALSLNVFFTAIAMMGLQQIKTIFTIYGLLCGMLFFSLSLLSDLRSILYPKKGVGVFFGTFNPLHKTHVRLLLDTITKRNLSRVYIHATVVPKLHRDALEKNEIEIIEHREGMRIYQKTSKADLHVNYFPTGNRFYEFETRCNLMRIAIKEAGLEQQVVVLSLPEVYEQNGFYGVLSTIKKMHPDQPIHGVHGSDLGGMWVRSIYDESGWIYPAAFKRNDGVSATAIRNGASGMTTQYVSEILHYLRTGVRNFAVGGSKFKFEKGVLNYES